jgi:hypothetical protein
MRKFAVNIITHEPDLHIHVSSPSTDTVIVIDVVIIPVDHNRV